MVNGMNTSGLGYDSSTHSITTELAVCDSYIHDLCIIFGKDRAQDSFEEQTTKNEEFPNAGSNKRKCRVVDVIKGITIATNVLRENPEKTANSMNQAILAET
uniref:Uncharacterized protein n=1 Tax=Lactuca sativa TaxID=4236 RepID=A0A9R1UKL0_LACSA|nr:hypothetical protein LSAT_V11C800448890 [Lactuca sativa]